MFEYFRHNCTNGYALKSSHIRALERQSLTLGIETV